MSLSSHEQSPSTCLGEQDLVFITISQPDHLRQKATQKKIRRHVMSQVGRSRKKRPKFFTVALEISANAAEASTSVAGKENPVNSLKRTRVPRPIFPYGTFAVDPTPRARELIHFSKPLELIPCIR
jgi:hypothetical protein